MDRPNGYQLTPGRGGVSHVSARSGRGLTKCEFKVPGYEKRELTKNAITKRK